MYKFDKSERVIDMKKVSWTLCYCIYVIAVGFILQSVELRVAMIAGGWLFYVGISMLIKDGVRDR